MYIVCLMRGTGHFPTILKVQPAADILWGTFCSHEIFLHIPSKRQIYLSSVINLNTICSVFGDVHVFWSELHNPGKGRPWATVAFRTIWKKKESWACKLEDKVTALLTSQDSVICLLSRLGTAVMRNLCSIFGSGRTRSSSPKYHTVPRVHPAS